jgi:hypothetical protein
VSGLIEVLSWSGTARRTCSVVTDQLGGLVLNTDTSGLKGQLEDHEEDENIVT